MTGWLSGCSRRVGFSGDTVDLVHERLPGSIGWGHEVTGGGGGRERRRDPPNTGDGESEVLPRWDPGLSTLGLVGLHESQALGRVASCGLQSGAGPQLIHGYSDARLLRGDLSPSDQIRIPSPSTCFLFFFTGLFFYFSKFIHLKFIHLKFTHLKFSDPKFINQKFIYPI